MTDSHRQNMKESSTYDLSLLESSMRKWETSPSLQTYYRDLYIDALSRRADGPSIEIGSGCGFIKQIDPEVITTDLVKTKFVDEQASAYSIEEIRTPFRNLIAIDVLHHLTEPFRFLESASKSINEGSRIILCEPAATVFGQFFYNKFHHEPCSPDEITAPFQFKEDASGLFANMGMGVALFRNRYQSTEKLLSPIDLQVKSIHYRDFLAYPLTGGFSKPAFMPSRAIGAILAFEKALPQFLLELIGLRMTIVLEKT